MIISKKIIKYKKIGSTNDEAKRLIRAGEDEGTVVVAEEQTKGRGKPGSRWFSPKGNIYLSVIVKPYKNPKKLAPITLMTALAARAMIIKVTNLPCVIKWPNDLLVHGKKVGGILCERLTSGHIIIGIGINVKTTPNRLKGAATSLRQMTGRKFPLGKCLKVLLAELDREYLAYLAKV